MRLTPSAQQAATASTGISSTSLGIKSPPISKGLSGPWVTRRSPTGSPATSRLPRISMRAPICSSTSRIPVRLGLRPTFSTVRSAPGVIAPATSQKAAELISPGTTTDWPFSWAPGRTTTSVPPGPPTLRSAPKARSMRSLWSRDWAGSITVVGPSAVSAASRIALFTWAEATGVCTVVPTSRWPATAKGA